MLVTTMKLSAARTQDLKRLLEEELGLKYKDEDLDRVGLAIMRFVLRKEFHRNQPKSKGPTNER